MNKMKALLTSCLLIGLVNVSKAVDQGNGEIVTASINPIQILFNQAEKVSIINSGSVTVYAAANCETNLFIIYMTETNAVPIPAGNIYTFDWDDMGPKINSICLQTLSGTASVTLSGSGTYAGNAIASGAPVTVTNDVNVSVINTALVSIVTMPASAGPTALTTNAQDFTTGWVDLGGEIDCSGFNSLVVGFIVDINNSVNVRIRALGKFASGGANEYLLPLKTPESSVVNVAGEYYELTDDADQTIALQWEVDNSLPYMQIQIQAGTVGATAGQIDASEYVLGYK